MEYFCVSCLFDFEIIIPIPQFYGSHCTNLFICRVNYKVCTCSVVNKIQLMNSNISWFWRYTLDLVDRIKSQREHPRLKSLKIPSINNMARAWERVVSENRLVIFYIFICYNNAALVYEYKARWQTIRRKNYKKNQKWSIMDSFTRWSENQYTVEELCLYLHER